MVDSIGVINGVTADTTNGIGLYKHIKGELPDLLGGPQVDDAGIVGSDPRQGHEKDVGNDAWRDLQNENEEGTSKAFIEVGYVAVWSTEMAQICAET